MVVERHFRTRVRAWTTEESGRPSAINMGYRPDLSFEGEQYVYGGVLLSDSSDDISEVKEWIALGDTREVDFWLRSPELILPRLRVGQTFRLMEGRNPTADGVITCIYPANGSEATP